MLLSVKSEELIESNEARAGNDEPLDNNMLHNSQEEEFSYLHFSIAF